MEEAKPVETPANPFMEALAKLSPEDKALIESRFEEIVGNVDMHKASAQNFERKYNEATKASEADKQMLDDQIKLFLKNTQADTKYAAHGMESCAKSLLNSDNTTEMRRSLDRMLTVANREFAERAAPVQRDHAGQSPTKRARPEINSKAPEPEPLQSELSPLQRAFSATFSA